MQGLSSRFAWNNLPLRVKTTVIFVMQILLIAAPEEKVKRALFAR